LIEAADKSGIWVRDLREQSGLTEPIIRRVLKGFEQRKLVKSIKAVGTQKKSYILYNIEADESVTGGTFYSNQQFDSQFVQALIDFCVNALKVGH
jgi:DNA-directed RNA polymerase III subunit RPC6